MSSSNEPSSSSSPPQATPQASYTVAEPEDLPAELRDRPLSSSTSPRGPEVQSGATSEATDEGDAKGDSGMDTRRKDKGKERAKAEDRFSCCICLDLAEDPVVTPCGHLTCWPCLHEWLVTSNKRTCPVCKAAVTVEKLIPIYSSSNDGGEQEKDPRQVLPRLSPLPLFSLVLTPNEHVNREKPLPPRPRPEVPPLAARSFNPFGSLFPASTLSSTTSGFSSSSFSFHAGGLFPLSGVSMSYTYPPAEGSNLNPRATTLTRGLGRDQEWLRQVFQQVFLVLFFAVFVMITFTG